VLPSSFAEMRSLAQTIVEMYDEPAPIYHPRNDTNEPFNQPPRFRFAASQLFEVVYAKYWHGKRKVGTKANWWVMYINKQFIVLHFAAIHHALSAWTTGIHKQGPDFNRHNVLGMSSLVVAILINVMIGTYNRLSAEWDALSLPVQKKLKDELVAAIKARQELEGNVKVANERPFNDQRRLEGDFLKWNPPHLQQLRSAAQANDPTWLDLRYSPSPSPPTSTCERTATPPVVLTPAPVLLSPIQMPPPATGDEADTQSLTQLTV
jgi:hypothetical protein